MTDTNRTRTLPYKTSISNFERELGDISVVDTPVPMPNTEVKHHNAENSCTAAKIGRCLLLSIFIEYEFKTEWC